MRYADPPLRRVLGGRQRAPEVVLQRWRFGRRAGEIQGLGRLGFACFIGGFASREENFPEVCHREYCVGALTGG